MLAKYLILYTTLLYCINSERNFRVQLTKIECIPEPGLLTNITCLLSERDNKSYMSMTLRPSRRITSLNMRFVLEASMSKRTKSKLMDFQQDMCIFLKGSPKQGVMKILHKYLMKFSNRVPVCPLEQNFTYIIKDYYVDADDLPTVTPELNFRLTMFIYDKTKVTFTFKGEGRIIHNKNIKDMKKTRNTNRAVDLN